MTLRITMAAGTTVLKLSGTACLALLFLTGTVLAQDAPTLTMSPQIQTNESPPVVTLETPASGSPAQALAPASDTALPQLVISEPASEPAAPLDLTASEDDLFQRLRRGFAIPDINSDLVLHHQQWYLNRPDYLRRMVERSSPYLHHIIEELEKRGMPMEIALLPMVESAYNPMAYSRAKASGLWQFIPATGKRYKLEQNWWKDERRDIVASTSAALDYLQTIYEMHGDWHLALASYNWGEGAVGRAVRKNEAKGLPSDYLSLTMPKETRHYVPKLQALKNIFSNPNILAELNIDRVPNRPYFSTVTKMANIDVKLAAQLAEMPVQDFVALNPSHNKPVIKSETPLIIPTEKLEAFMSNLEAHESSNKPLSTWQAYTLRPGEKLEQVAPRFGMTVANLKAANGIKGKIKLSPGFTLLVPGHGANTVDIAALPESPRLPEADPAPRSYTVRKGETLQSIAKRNNISVAELKRINNLRSDKLSPGTRLAFSDDARPKTGKADNTKPVKPAGKTSKVTLYTVRKGDTLTSIAKQFKVGRDDILRWNKISPNALKPGKTLTIQLAQNP